MIIVHLCQIKHDQHQLKSLKYLHDVDNIKMPKWAVHERPTTAMIHAPHGIHVYYMHHLCLHHTTVALAVVAAIIPIP